MADIEKIIKGLKELSGFLFKEYGKAQAEEASIYYNRFLTVDDALVLLKEQEAKTGHWVSVNDADIVAIDNDGCPERACFCSECKKYLIASDEYAVYGRYCPFCGAKMEGGEVNG